MKNTVFTGAGVAIITPMNADGSINWNEFGKIIDFQIENGTDYLCILGTTAETPTLTDNEKLKIVADKIIGLYKKNHNIVVVVSAQGKTTDKLISEAKELSETIISLYLSNIIFAKTLSSG